MGGCAERERFFTQPEIGVNSSILPQHFGPKTQPKLNQILLKPHIISGPLKIKYETSLTRLSAKERGQAAEEERPQRQEVEGQSCLQVRQGLNLMETSSHYIQEQSKFLKSGSRDKQSQCYQESIILPKEIAGCSNPYKIYQGPTKPQIFQVESNASAHH